MINESCFLSATDQLGITLLNDFTFSNGNVPILPLVGFFTTQRITSSPADDVLKICSILISTKRFSKAADFMLNEIYENSKILANKFGIEVNCDTDMAQLMEELRHNNVISESEWNRLTVLQMAIDGIDMEVHECGGEIKPSELNYLSEFVTIVKEILARNNQYIGVFMNAISNYDAFTIQANMLTRKNITLRSPSVIINPSSTCTLYCVSQNTANINSFPTITIMLPTNQ